MRRLISLSVWILLCIVLLVWLNWCDTRDIARVHLGFFHNYGVDKSTAAYYQPDEK